MLTPLPSSWSTLTWQQLCRVWQMKQRYGGQPDAAICAAWLDLCHLKVVGTKGVDGTSGENVYLLQGDDRQQYTTTPHQLAYYALETMPWFHYPYGDPGQEEKKDKQGNITQEHRDAHPGYVGPLRDALMLNDETVTVRGSKVRVGTKHKGWRRILPTSPFPQCSRVFALPQVACNNLTWQQYRALQSITPQLWKDGISDADALNLQAQFLAHILVPRSLALLDQNGGTIRLRPHFTFRYDDERADRLVAYWQRKLIHGNLEISTLFHICHQVWQTALVYYNAAYPMLFEGGSNHGPMRDALQGEVGTVNTIMKYAGYSEQQQVYDSNLPFVLDILNTMTKEAKEIERMNAKVKRK